MRIKYSKVTTEPALEPIASSLAKIDLKVDNTVEDGLIAILIQASREMVEQFTNRSLITQTREIRMDYFPSYEITLLNGPVQSVASISYYDDNNDLIVFPAGSYWTDTHSDIARVVVKDSWPSTYDRPNAVIITYVCGYGSAAEDVPAPLRKAILFILGHLYENRQNVIVSGSPTAAMEIPFGAQLLMNTYVLEQPVI